MGLLPWLMGITSVLIIDGLTGCLYEQLLGELGCLEDVFHCCCLCTIWAHMWIGLQRSTQPNDNIWLEVMATKSVSWLRTMSQRWKENQPLRFNQRRLRVYWLMLCLHYNVICIIWVEGEVFATIVLYSVTQAKWCRSVYLARWKTHAVWQNQSFETQAVCIHRQGGKSLSSVFLKKKVFTLADFRLVVTWLSSFCVFLLLFILGVLLYSDALPTGP